MNNPDKQLCNQHQIAAGVLLSKENNPPSCETKQINSLSSEHSPYRWWTAGTAETARCTGGPHCRTHSGARRRTTRRSNWPALLVAGFPRFATPLPKVHFIIRENLPSPISATLLPSPVARIHQSGTTADGLFCCCSGQNLLTKPDSEMCPISHEQASKLKQQQQKKLSNHFSSSLLSVPLLWGYAKLAAWPGQGASSVVVVLGLLLQSAKNFPPREPPRSCLLLTRTGGTDGHTTQ